MTDSNNQPEPYVSAEQLAKTPNMIGGTLLRTAATWETALGELDKRIDRLGKPEDWRSYMSDLIELLRSMGFAAAAITRKLNNNLVNCYMNEADARLYAVLREIGTTGDYEEEDL